MKGELTAIIEAAPEGGYWAMFLNIPGQTVKAGPSWTLK